MHARPAPTDTTFPIRAAALGAALLPVFAHAQPVLVSDGAVRSVDTWAAKGMTRNAVAICFDPAGNLYVAESDRAGNAVQDTRNIEHLHAVEDDLRFKSVEDRRTQIRAWLAAGAFESGYFTKTEDRVRVLTDTDGDGVADRAKVFAGGFNDELDGIGAGLLWQDGTLYFTCIPNLWALRDTKGALEADERKSLAFGFGVRWCFYGHDLHGLTAGPDGRIYFSMGDRGFNITTKEGRHFVGVDRGGVFRCWPDGSELELVYEGLRNPQELAFNELGDLFTGDNNCDSGDLARVVQIVEGGDSGWRQDVQSLPSRGPWNREATWKTLKDVSGPARPAWTLPPVEYMCAGPSGMTLYPGTGESHAYDGCFFLVDFYGSGSTVHAFRCLPKGAGFTVADHVEYYKGATITDIAWGNDSRLYMSDWGGGWQPNPNGNVVTVTNKTVRKEPGELGAINEVLALIKAGYASRSSDELLALLRHRDQRIRQGAQYELAKRGTGAIAGLDALAKDKDTPIVTRSQAIWALGQIARRSPDAATRLDPLLADADPEVRVQALRTLGDLQQRPALVPRFITLLKDPSARVRLAAAIAAGRSKDPGALQPLLDLLADNNNSDLVIRHAASYSLSLIANPEETARRAATMNAAARLGAVVALRRLGHERVAVFLGDADPSVAIEAARAIYDLRLSSGMPVLAALLDRAIPADRAIEPLMRRAIEANVLLGTDDCARRLAGFAASPDLDQKWRLLALERLDGWDRPLKREGVWGNWVDLPARQTDAVGDAVRGHIDAFLDAAKGNDRLLTVAYRLQARYAMDLQPMELARLVADANRPEQFRLAVLDHLALRAPEGATAACAALLDPGAHTLGALRHRAEEILAGADPARATEILRHAAAAGELSDRQHAIKVLGSIQADSARAAISAMVRDLRYGSIDGALALDTYEAAMNLPKDSPARASAEAAGLQARRPPGYATALLSAGGDAKPGRELFLHHPSAECVRCHMIDGIGGTAGPDLSTVGRRRTVPELVESLVEPGAVVTPGYGQITAMPAMPQFLTPRQVRDVVAYLGTLGAPPPTAVRRAEAGSHGGISLPRTLGAFLVIGIGAAVWRGATRRA